MNETYNKIYETYNKDKSLNTWDPMDLREMDEIIKKEAKKCTPNKRAFHTINMAIAILIDQKHVHSDHKSRLGAWEHSGVENIRYIRTYVSDIILLGVKVPCSMMKAACHIHAEPESYMAVDTIVEAVYMANGLDIDK